MVETEVMYLGPLVAITHAAKMGIQRTFFRNKWVKYEMDIDDIIHYANSGGFKVKPVKVQTKKIHPIVEEQTEEIIIGG